MNTAAITRKSNRGFSLVELIIVIAIMAILTALLAPQFLKYVERAREARDRANIMSVYNAFQIAVTDPAVAINGTGYNAVNPSSGAGITYYATGRLNSIGNTLQTAFKEIYGDHIQYNPADGKTAGNTLWLPALVSKKYKDGIIFRFSYSESYPTTTVKGYIRVYCPPLD